MRTLIVIILLLGAAVALQYRYDTLALPRTVRRAAGGNRVFEPIVIPAQAARATAIGYDNVAADLQWLALIQYFGSGNPYVRYAIMPALLDSITTLDPKFRYPYIFANLILPSQGDLVAARKLSARGIAANPDDWEIPYYLATAYHIYAKDYESASKYMTIAAEKRTAPPIAKLLASIYFQKAGERETAYALWKVIAETSDNDYTKERAQKYLGQYELILFLEDTAKKFNTQYGRFPSTLDELVEKRFLKAIPPNPLERELTIDPATGTVSEKSVGSD